MWRTRWEKSGAHGGRKAVHTVGEKRCTRWEKSGAHGGRKAVHTVGEKRCTRWEKSGAHGGRKAAHTVGEKRHSCPSLPTKSTILHRIVLHRTTYLGYPRESHVYHNPMCLSCPYPRDSHVYYHTCQSYVSIPGTPMCTTTHVNPMCLSCPSVLCRT